MALSSAVLTFPGILAQPGKCPLGEPSQSISTSCQAVLHLPSTELSATVHPWVPDLFNVLWWLGEC